MLAANVSDSSNIIVAILAILTFIALAAGVVGYARANFAKAQIEALRGDRDDLLTRVQILENDKVRTDAALLAEQGKVAALEKVVTGKEDLEHIQASLTEHDQLMRDQATKIMENLTLILAAIGPS
jgi:biopolymer transport protein ExbB/TolQ